MNKIITLLILIMFAASCGGSGSGKVAGEVVTGSTAAITDDGLTVTDTVNDVVSDSEFDFSTVTAVDFEITVLDNSGEPVDKALVTLVDDNSAVVTASTTDETGLAQFTATVEKMDTAASVKIEQDGFKGKEIAIENIGSLEAVIRTVGLEKAEEAITKSDRDSDGVPDESDMFPDNGELAFVSEGEFTLAFEDLYPSKGDADFNDAVVKIKLTEKINSRNEVVEVSVYVTPLASGAGYRNLFGIYINGERYVLIKDLKAAFNGAWNSKRGEKPAAGTPAELNIRFSTPVPRTNMKPMPYDPFIVPNNDSPKGEVHLPSVDTAYTGKRLDSDNFPWAIIVPDSWSWPYEGTLIKTAYPEFDEWYLSEGAVSADWYLRPDAGNVYNIF